MLVPVHVSDTANQQLMQTWRIWGNRGILSALWRHCMKAELLPDSFRRPVAKEPRTKHVSHEILNSQRSNCPWLALEKKQTFTILLWLVTYLTAGALDFHPQPWGQVPTDQIISPTRFRSTAHGELGPVRVVSSQLLLWTVEIWIVWMKWWFLKCSAFTGIQEPAFPQWGI